MARSSAIPVDNPEREGFPVPFSRERWYTGHMNGRKALLIGSFLAIAIVSSWSATYRYRETTGMAVAEYTTTVTKDGATDDVTLFSHYLATGETHLIVFGADGSAKSWTYRYPDGMVRKLTRSGDAITCETVGSAAPVKRAVVDASPWFASLNYGVSELARKGARELAFWIVNPDNGKPYRMKARVLGDELVKTEGNTTEATRVQVTVASLPAGFFSMDYWYRKTDFALLRFIGSENGPGSPKTLVELIGED